MGSGNQQVNGTMSTFNALPAVRHILLAQTTANCLDTKAFATVAPIRLVFQDIDHSVSSHI